MTTLGNNVRTVASVGERGAIRQLYGELFGARLNVPAADLDVFVLADGGALGVYYVEPARALAPSSHVEAGTWIELCVPNVEVAVARLHELGLQPLPYHDRAHPYFQGPGGQVFRTAVGG